MAAKSDRKSGLLRNRLCNLCQNLSWVIRVIWVVNGFVTDYFTMQMIAIAAEIQLKINKVEKVAVFLDTL